jgi:hypothetical protein
VLCTTLQKILPALVVGFEFCSELLAVSVPRWRSRCEVCSETGSSVLNMLQFIIRTIWNLILFRVRFLLPVAEDSCNRIGLASCAEKGNRLSLLRRVRFVPEIAVAKRVPALKIQRKRECLHAPAILDKLFRLAVLMVGACTEFVL